MREDLEELLEQYVIGLLRELAAETSRNIKYSLIDVVDRSVCLSGVVTVENSRGEANVELRLTKRKTGRPTRFTLQAITRDLSLETGYSGFIAKGRLKSPSGVEILGRANTYNVFDWDEGNLTGQI